MALFPKYLSMMWRVVLMVTTGDILSIVGRVQRGVWGRS
jgi:hypothetical protein